MTSCIIVSHDEATTEARQLARLSYYHRAKASSTGQKEVVTGQAKSQSVPPEPKQKSQLARPRPQAPRTQTEVAACQATTHMPPEPKQKSQIARPRPQAPRTQKRVTACQATTSMLPDAQTEVAACIRKTPPRNFPAFSRKFVQNILNSLNEQIEPEYVTPQENIVNSATYEQNFFGVASSLWNYFGVFTFLRSKHIERKHYLLVSTIKGQVFPVPSRQIQSPPIPKEITSLAEPEAAGATPG
ncbi:hypothetical protein B0H14DRAFT_2579390 [Mycena olivaceomarginata]|nr:hypothetical protein B0H14DRAFT_2579390 [Mycena olivaceomarginata]